MFNQFKGHGLLSFSIFALILITGSSCKKDKDPSYDEIYFNPVLQYETITDIDGNKYKTILIGTQIWMAENLRVSKYNDGTPVPLITEAYQWEAKRSAAYCTNMEVYGFLYNHYAVAGLHNICPTGWHIPDNSEWTELGIFLGGESIAGKKLKESGTIHWGIYNTESTNEGGFTALPGGLCDHHGSKYSMGNSTGGAGYWWSATERDSAYAWSYSLGGADIRVYKSPESFKRNGFSVRCIKDNS